MLVDDFVKQYFEMIKYLLNYCKIHIRDKELINLHHRALYKCLK